jgi:hypothetical protein
MSIRDPSRPVSCLPVTRLDMSRAYPYPPVLTHIYSDPDTCLPGCTPSLHVLPVYGGAAALLAVLHGSDHPTGWKRRCMAVPLGEGDATLLVTLHGSGGATELGPTWVVKL